MEQPEIPAGPWLTLAVDDPALRRVLERALAERGLRARFVTSSDVAAATADVALVEHGDLEPDSLDDRAHPGGPGVVVMGETNASEEARIVAAGASAVLDPQEPNRILGDQLADLVEAEVGGGLHGPDSGGAVAEPTLADFHSRSSRMREFVDLVRRIADTDSTLLVTGETGVGKERLARAIHSESSRAAAAFVGVNCGALPDNLLESELFGHEKGAFTGAETERKGRFEEADGGTLFLDEIGDMPLHLQVKLLTALQRREIRRLGAEEPRAIDVRIISATNRDLTEEVAAGRFREDLLFRLNVVAFEIPPLRERPEDVPWFVGRFLRHFAEEHDREDVTEIAPDAMRELLRYAWPGNVRELVNVIERSVLLCRGSRIELADLPDSVRPGAPGRAGVASASGATAVAATELHVDVPLTEARRRIVDDFERRYLDAILRAETGAVGRTAERAGINPRTLYEKMRRHGLRKEDYA